MLYNINANIILQFRKIFIMHLDRAATLFSSSSLNGQLWNTTKLNLSPFTCFFLQGDLVKADQWNKCLQNRPICWDPCYIIYLSTWLAQTAPIHFSRVIRLTKPQQGSSTPPSSTTCTMQRVPWESPDTQVSSSRFVERDRTDLYSQTIRSISVNIGSVKSSRSCHVHRISTCMSPLNPIESHWIPLMSSAGKPHVLSQGDALTSWRHLSFCCRKFLSELAISLVLFQCFFSERELPKFLHVLLDFYRIQLVLFKWIFMSLGFLMGIPSDTSCWDVSHPSPL